MNKPLVRPIAYPDESPCSVLLRSSEENGWKSSTAFISAYSSAFPYRAKSLYSIVVNKNAWKDISNTIGITNNVSCYERMPISHESMYKFQDFIVPYKSLRIKKPALCPICINEKNYALGIWDHQLITACTIHKIKLIDTCPNCNKQIYWNRKGILTCSCDHNLSTSQSTPTDTKVTQYIELVIKKNDSYTLDLMFQLFRTLGKFFKNLNIDFDQHQLASFAGQFFIDQEVLKDSLLNHIKNSAQSYGLHPRLTMLPFLSSHQKEINQFAEKTLRELDNSEFIIKKELNNINFHIDLSSSGKVLGISPYLTKGLIKNHFLSEEKFNGFKSISLSSTNELLKLFTTPIKSKNSYKTISSQIANNPKSSTKLIDIIKGVKSRKKHLSGMQISSGILSAQTETITKEYSFLKLTDVADLCGVHKENIRFSILAGVLKKIDPNETKGNTIYVDKKDATIFHNKYIFPIEIAKAFSCSPNNISAKLKASGVKAVSGPGIDRGLTYLFKRSDIESLDLKTILSRKNYKTNVGRKKKSLKEKITVKEHSIPLRVVANQLNISIQKSSSLIRKGYLKEVINNSRGKEITIESFEFVKYIQNNSSLITLKEASKSVLESEASFIRHWVNSQQVKLIENGLDRYISKKALVKVKRFKAKYVTSKEAGIITNTHRTHMLNLEKQNLITPAQQLLCGKQVVNFYIREQVMDICTK